MVEGEGRRRVGGEEGARFEVLPLLRRRWWREVALWYPEERTLVLRLLALPDALRGAEEKRAPNILCDFAFTLAQEFSRFYAAHHILSEQDEALRAARLGLCELTLFALKKILGILGIDVPERM